jgi:hypothetical protein
MSPRPHQSRRAFWLELLGAAVLSPIVVFATIETGLMALPDVIGVIAGLLVVALVIVWAVRLQRRDRLRDVARSERAQRRRQQSEHPPKRPQ